jgi:hypothetical protein
MRAPITRLRLRIMSQATVGGNRVRSGLRHVLWRQANARQGSPDGRFHNQITSGRLVELIGPGVDNRLPIEEIHGGNNAILEFILGCDADGKREKERASSEKKASIRLSQEP